MSSVSSKYKMPRTVFITGGTGFILSNTVKYLLETDTEANVVILDINNYERLAVEFLESVSDRLTFFQGDVRDRSVLDKISSQFNITHIIHAATVTGFPTWELQDPVRYIDVNLLGTVNVLEWARKLIGLQRFLNVGTGGVYGSPTKDSPESPQPEEGPFNPPELYAVSKYAAELVIRRYGELFNLDTCLVRLTTVFGPMERPTPGRVTMSIVFRMMRAVINNRPLRISVETLKAGGDFLSSEDIAFATVPLVFKKSLSFDAYNIGFGVYTTVGELFDIFKKVVPDFEYELVDEERAEIIMDPTKRLARWNAHAIDRISSELSWRPRSLFEQLKSYNKWVMEDPERRCPNIEVT